MKPKIGLALGGGSARGWAHIGIIRSLIEAGIKPDVVAGTSMGALVGGAYVSGYLDDLEGWVSELNWQEVVSMLDIRLSGGLIHGAKLLKRLGEGMEGIDMQSLAVPFGAVATDLDTGKEIWLREGDILSAIRASIALPGLLSPLHHDERWLVDGGLTNPVPVSLCRALGADYVIAVDLNSQVLHHRAMQKRSEEDKHGQQESAIDDESSNFDRLGFLLHGVLDKFRQSADDKVATPSLLDVAVRSITIMSSRITRSRLAGEPADMLLLPRLAHIGLLEFHRGNEAIEEGHQEIARHLSAVNYIKEIVKDNK